MPRPAYYNFAIKVPSYAHPEKKRMAVDADRRTALFALGAALTLSGASCATAEAETAVAAPPDNSALAELSSRLRKAPRRRDFKSVPMILANPDFWDGVALTDVLNYKGVTSRLGTTRRSPVRG